MHSSGPTCPDRLAAGTLARSQREAAEGLEGLSQQHWQLAEGSLLLACLAMMPSLAACGLGFEPHSGAAPVPRPGAAFVLRPGAAPAPALHPVAAAASAHCGGAGCAAGGVRAWCRGTAPAGPGPLPSLQAGTR